MQRIVEYRVVLWRTADKLEESVNKWIAAGWQPLGGPSFNGAGYLQALVVYGTEDAVE